MMKLNRTEKPQVLKDNWKQWTKDYLNTNTWNTSWHNKHEKLLTELKVMSGKHCAFCDELLFDLANEDGQIEHFRNKSQYKCLAYAWQNLYPICDKCNKKKSKKNIVNLVKPDEKNYEFADWFRFDLASFELKLNKFNKNWERAEAIINLYKLNDEDKVERRKIEFDKIKRKIYDNIEEQPFRYIFLSY